MELKARVWFRSLLFFSKNGEVTNEKGPIKSTGSAIYKGLRAVLSECRV